MNRKIEVMKTFNDMYVSVIYYWIISVGEQIKYNFYILT